MTGEHHPFHPDVEYSFSLTELSQCCGVSSETIVILVGEGVLSPHGQSPREWQFADADVARALRAVRLEHDLGLNPAGAALAVELMDEMQQLRQRVRLLERLVFD
ncbi:MAG: chaperone modulator CbpM [Chromatiaceae bacterium]|nr:chaperone modulator CbpM [Chromatiaceae bacterium]MCW5584921.1 chaperone modulator CbpM [Chromatiales bacterium]HOP16551.1 chaperone modulator CbpM [Gammaproteobacteria bacterium]MCP5428688.1 chaperone modulator CbpM [Chromatiaceae bacterium]MCP5434584.1 chaperone modulator CbpM [Chromatiaceae bacterium]